MAKVKEAENMRIWDALGKTDPAHTKQFTRAGGFKGTAVKPMWANKQMTEFFGPCGNGWRTGQPEYTVVPAGEEIMVYCTASIWWTDQGNEYGPVFGVGGDKVVSQIFAKDGQGNKIRGEDGKFKTYPQTDDEAFKKAYTDALSNAMKFIGVAADVHMGMFDDSKYVQSVREEFKSEAEEKAKAEVLNEVERQKAAYVPSAKEVFQSGEMGKALEGPMKGNPGIIPPELDWSYNAKTGILIASIVDTKLAKTKAGAEFLAIALNNAIEGKTNLLYYWHATHRQELLAAKGKVVKVEVVSKAKGYTLEHVLEIDGVKVEVPAITPTESTLEVKARFLASALEMDEETLRELHGSVCKGDWQRVVDTLEHKMAEREVLK